MQLEKHSYLEISLLCVICDRDKRQKVTDILEKHDSLFSLVSFGKGTANSKTLSYLGLGETEKAVFFNVLTTDRAYQIMDALDEALQLAKPGHGISFIAKVRQGCFRRLVEFVSDTNGGITMQQNSPHNLIFVVLNHGYSEDVMEAARTAGATGGTVLRARGAGAAGMEKFFGATIAPEKEMLMIVAQDDASGEIMSVIAEKAGPATDACAVSFSLPVNAVKGIHTVE
ncbi:MAG: P-II family nitrogen regulator [Saccharofermentanales bacterium]|jgi:nitrogen regulatory protein PII|nr:hypothetical protein [Eubacteriales bacterium]HQP24723.1 hypothetical protein [Smithellaceae bacterium]